MTGVNFQINFLRRAMHSLAFQLKQCLWYSRALCDFSAGAPMQNAESQRPETPLRPSRVQFITYCLLYPAKLKAILK
jgi:hypothetical protein